METKKCLLCGKTIIKKYNDSKKTFKARKFCGLDCSTKSGIKKLIKHNKESGPWNKGKKIELSDEHKKNLALANKIRFQKETKSQKKQRIDKLIKTRSKNGRWVSHFNGRTGENNYTWKGEGAKYSAKHKWVYNNWVKTGTCELCGETPQPKRKTRLRNLTDWHNKDNQYKRIREDWIELCRACHIKLHKSERV